MALESKKDGKASPDFSNDAEVLAAQKDVAMWQTAAKISKKVFYALFGIFIIFLAWQLVFPPTPPIMWYSARDIVPNLLEQVHMKGFGLSIHDNVVFYEAGTVATSALIGKVPIPKENIRISCVDVTLCGNGSPLTVTDAEVRSSQRVLSTVAVCYNPGMQDIYRIVIGKNFNETRNAAESACGLN